MPPDCANPLDGFANRGVYSSCEERVVPYFPALLDETTFSYVCRAQLLISCTNRSAVIAALFGSKVISIHKPWHFGFGFFSQHLYGKISADVLAKHSLIALFQTFSHPARYSKAVERAMACRPGTHQFLCSAQVKASEKTAYFKTSPALCLACVEQDLREYYFAYYRRQHQVLASDYCARHKKQLITSCSKCGITLSYEQLPSLCCLNCGATYVSDETNESATDRLFKVRLGQFIDSMFMGRIFAIPQSQRIELLGARSENVVSSSSSALGDKLTEYIRAAYGDDLLKRLKLLPDSQASSKWPALILSGDAMLDNPIANALLTSALWDSTEEYLIELRAYI